jgi:hypothetical protein
VAKRIAHLIDSSTNNKRHVCIDKENEEEIMNFLKADPARLKKFKHIVKILLEGLRNSELYDKEEVSKKATDVTAMKLFKQGQNIRLYCKEQRTEQGVLCIIVAELLEKKKEEGLSKTTKNLIEKVGGYEYVIEEREKQSVE